ncbi:MAG: hypothetical protein JO004_11450 [Methylobacteriaceae bacterium]|nr:hypothetical protein [Methylobacteriaceae bacterium]
MRGAKRAVIASEAKQSRSKSPSASNQAPAHRSVVAANVVGDLLRNADAVVLISLSWDLTSRTGRQLTAGIVACRLISDLGQYAGMVSGVGSAPNVSQCARVRTICSTRIALERHFFEATAPVVADYMGDAALHFKYERNAGATFVQAEASLAATVFVSFLIVFSGMTPAEVPFVPTVAAPTYADLTSRLTPGNERTWPDRNPYIIATCAGTIFGC